MGSIARSCFENMRFIEVAADESCGLGKGMQRVPSPIFMAEIASLMSNLSLSIDIYKFA